jgi:mRNA-degrading endonuclease toxin of MazEF toxin-antitoxin module
MRRGDIWTVAGGKDHAGKPRPIVIVQDDSFDATDSITVCAFTTDETEAPLFRSPVEPNGGPSIVDPPLCRDSCDRLRAKTLSECMAPERAPPENTGPETENRVSGRAEAMQLVQRRRIALRLLARPQRGRFAAKPALVTLYTTTKKTTAPPREHENARHAFRPGHTS